MTAVIDAVYRNGVFCPATPPDLPEGTAVRVIVNTAVTVPSEGRTLSREERVELIRQITSKFDPTTDNPEVTSRNIDQILYGSPGGAR